MTENNVTALPTAAADPLPKRRWHGCYPKGVVPISTQRNKRRAEEFEQRAQAMKAAAERSWQPDDMEIERRGVERLRRSLQADGWPWPGIDIGRFERLTEAQRDALGFVFLDALCRMEQRGDARTD